MAGQTYTQPLTVGSDPRETTPASFAAQLSLEQKLMAGMRESYEAYQAAKQHGNADAADRFAVLAGTLSALATDVEGDDATPTPAMYDAVRRELEQLTALLHTSK